MKKKRVLFGLTTAVLTMTVLASCGSSKKSETIGTKSTEVTKQSSSSVEEKQSSSELAQTSKDVQSSVEQNSQTEILQNTIASSEEKKSNVESSIEVITSEEQSSETEQLVEIEPSSEVQTSEQESLTDVEATEVESSSEEKYYKVSFVDYDGDVLYENNVLENTIPEFFGTNPTRDADAQYTYTFNGWDKELSKVTSETVYTATYTSTVRQYNVTFKDEDGTVLSSKAYDYNTEASALDVPTPTKDATAQYTYTFAGWDKELSKVTADKEYIATYNAVIRQYKVTFKDEDGTVLLAEKLYDYGTTADKIQ
nr:hypothetical protein [Acholeplasmatales bacterium]